MLTTINRYYFSFERWQTTTKSFRRRHCTMVFGKRGATFVGRTIYRVIILRGTSVCYILLEITHTHTRTHTYTGLNYQEIPRSLARELFVALSARRLHRDKNFCLVYLCLPTNAATNEREKKISRWKFLF